MTTAGRQLSEVLHEADLAVRKGVGYSVRTWSTGFDPLDTYLGSGVRAGELVLLGGAQGLGKTTFALQMARNIAAAGGAATYICFEHNEQEILERLLAMEAGLLAGPEAIGLTRLRQTLQTTTRHAEGLVGALGGVGAGSEAVQAVRGYAERLRIVRGTPAVDLPALSQIAADAAQRGGVLFVDYLQKLPVPGIADEAERVTQIVETLKDVALQHAIPVVAIVAADAAGISGGRTRLHHLRGSSALAYEADVALLLNDKHGIVARHHLVYDPTAANRYRNWVICTIEKNRAGLDQIDLQFRKRFENGCFEPTGEAVAEQLLDDRIFTE
ncbi:MAG: hypothetical protein NVS3B26_28110 [Mycobacteriales bacterium]